MSDTATEAKPAPPERRRDAIVNFPTETPMTEYADAESLRASGVDDDALVSLGELTQLQSLELDGEFTDDGLAHLSGLDQLDTLKVVSPNVTSRGLRIFENAPGLKTLTIHRAALSVKGARGCAKRFPELKSFEIAGPMGVDHLIMLRGLPKLERIAFTGGGDIFGGGDGQLDRMSALEFLAASPNLVSFEAKWWNGKSMISDETIVAMMAAKPGLAVNGTWYDAKVFESPLTPEDLGDGTDAGDGTLVELTNDNFDDIIGSAPAAIVNFYMSNSNICKASLLYINAVNTAVGMLASTLAGRAVVAQLDESTQEDLLARLREQRIYGQIAVFRKGEFVGRIDAMAAQSILNQLQPVLVG